MRSIVFGPVTVFVTLLMAICVGTAGEYVSNLESASSGSLVAQWTVEGEPDGIAVGPEGEVYVNFNNDPSRITKYTPEGVMQTEWNLPGVIETNGIVVGPEGEVLVSIASLSSEAGSDMRLIAPGTEIRVVKYSSDGEFLSETKIDGMIETNGIAIGPGGEIYLGADGDTVIKFGPEGGVLTSWGFDGEMSGIAVDRAGDVLVSFRDSPRVAKFSPEGVDLAEFTVDGVIETNGIVVGPDGTIILVDLGYRVIELSADGEYLTDWTVEGDLTGIAAGPDGLLYTADAASSRVLVFEI